MFGNGQLANNPDEARALTKPFYSNPGITIALRVLKILF
jgi:hypothetical protein